MGGYDRINSDLGEDKDDQRDARRPERVDTPLNHGTQIRGIARIRKNISFELITCESGTDCHREEVDLLFRAWADQVCTDNPAYGY